MPEGYGYPKGEAILGKIKQGEFGSDVAKRPNEKLETGACLETETIYLDITKTKGMPRHSH